MVTLDELQQQVNRHQDVDLAPLFEAYRKQSNGDDMFGFVRFLREKGALNAAALAAIHRQSVAAATMAGDPNQTTSEPAEEASDKGVKLERYETMGLLGEGAMGSVHEARDIALHRRVAVKSLLPEMRKQKVMYDRFLAEMQITAQLDHPHIVPVYGLEVASDGSVAYAMKLVAGQEYGELLEQAKDLVEAGKALTGNYTLDARLEYFLKVCDAMAFAHERGIVHRDLKPSNVMIGKHNEVYVMDWGIARQMGAEGASADAGVELYDPKGEPAAKDRTQAGQMLGTPMYMSPEQASALNDELDGRSDLYTLGLILQEAVTLQPAVGGTTIVQVITNAMEAKREPVRAIRGSVPRELAEIIGKATCKKPAERYANVKALADDLRAFLRNEQISAAPDSFVQGIGRWVSKHRVHSMAIMLALLLAGAGATIGLLIRTSAIRQAQHDAELKRQEMQTRSALSAQAVDNELQRYEWALGRLVGTAQVVLSHAETSDAPVYFTSDFGGDGKPGDLTPSAHYGASVSVEHPAFSLSPGVERSSVDRELRSLEWLRPAWPEAVLTSLGVNAHKLAPASQRQLLTQTGVPIEAAYLTLASGLVVTYPGMDRGVEGDPRKDEDYLLAADKLGTHWRGPYPSKRGPMLSVAASVYDRDNRFRGVAGFRVSVARVFEKVQLADIGYVDETLMVRRDGTVIASSNPDRELTTLPYPEVVEAIERGESGNIERDGKLITFTPLRTLESYFVAVADLEDMAADETPAEAPVAAWASTATAATPAIKPPPSSPAPAPEPDEEEEDAGADAGEDATPPPNPTQPGPLPKPDPGDDFKVKNPFDRWENHP
jgi:eukaryotic-like serine/threonine-protein kinase